MKHLFSFRPRVALLALAAVALAVTWLTGLQADHAGLLLATGAAGLDLTAVNKALDALEAKLKSMSDKADGEMATLGKVSTDTKSALDNLGTQQRELADRLLGLEQKGLVPPKADGELTSWGAQFVKAAAFGDFVAGRLQKMRVEVKNTITNAVGNTFSDRRPSPVGGAFREFTLEQLLTTLPTTSNAVDYVRENVFTNAAAETTEGNAKPESSITTTLVTEPVATVAHWLKISRQLANDNPALAAYIDLRMRYGVNLRVENQIIAGNGTAPNISGFTKSGNFTAHGYAAATLTGLGLSATNRFDLIGKILGDCWAADYPADAIVLNPTDWWTMRLAKDTTGRYILGDPGVNIAPSLFNVPVVSCNAVTADNVLVASLANAATFYNREGVVVDMSESDSDNFTKNLVTIRAERRCMLAVERPAAVRYGDLTPA
jgi:HK97 family phage major capsid protein